jgi:hypothetical protein
MIDRSTFDGSVGDDDDDDRKTSVLPPTLSTSPPPKLPPPGVDFIKLFFHLGIIGQIS